MELNHETAMRLWNKSFGKETKAIDFAGRTIAKGAYNDRNSEFGWNVDHILPQCKGGKTADYNLMCCHILTNDEKANKFPAFRANNKTFEILKVENHYEISLVNKNKKEKHKVESRADKVNFYESASALRYLAQLRGTPSKPRFIGTVSIDLFNVHDFSVLDFIKKLFEEGNKVFDIKNEYYGPRLKIIIRNYDMPWKEDTANLLDKCILINTYLSQYFEPLKFFDSYRIIYKVDDFKNPEEFYKNCSQIDINTNYGLTITSFFSANQTGLFINELVRINTDAKEEMKEITYDGFASYDKIFIKLSDNLKKEVDQINK